MRTTARHKIDLTLPTHCCNSTVDEAASQRCRFPAIDSVYRWQGAVEHAGEFRLLLKTHAGGYAALEAAIRAQHPYDLPAIHALPTTHAYAPYAEWVTHSTRP